MNALRHLARGAAMRINADGELLTNWGICRLQLQECSMKISEISTVKVLTGHPDQPLAVAAAVLRDQSVGALVIVEPGDRQKRPLGILTDRDIVRGQLLKSADLHCLLV